MFYATEMNVGTGRRFHAAALSALFFLAAGCSDITEQTITFEAGLTVISPSGCQIEYTLDGLSNARCMLVLPGNLVVLSSDGVLYVMDTDSPEVFQEYTIGPVSPAGYRSMVYSPREGTIYAVGALGKVLEISFPDCQVLDEITAGVTPAELEITAGYPGYLWVADAASNAVYQVKLDDNVVYPPYNYPPDYTVQCMEASKWDDSLLVGTSSLVSRLEVLSPGSVRNSFMLDNDAPGSMLGLAAIPGDSNFVAVTSYNQIGVLCAYDRETYPDPPDRFYRFAYIPGSMFVLAAAADFQNAYALAYIGDGTSMLYRYSHVTAGLQECMELPGYPLDLKVSGSGTIYVLTYR